MRGSAKMIVFKYHNGEEWVELNNTETAHKNLLPYLSEPGIRKIMKEAIDNEEYEKAQRCKDELDRRKNE